MASGSRAADLPAGTIIVSGRVEVFAKEEDSATSTVPWTGTGSRWAVADEEIDPLLDLGATILRHGFGDQA